MTGLALFVLGVVYGPLLRWAVRERRREALPAAPLPRIPEWAFYAGPVGADLARRLEATDVEEWLGSVRETWDADLADLAERLRARTRPLAAAVDVRSAA